jgi:ribosome-associated translation inhibitor RaiA
VRGKNNLAIDVDDIDSDINYAIDNAFRRLKKILKRNPPQSNDLIEHDDLHAIVNFEA